MLCKDCKYWQDGECNRVKSWLPHEDETRRMDVCADAADTTNLSCWLETGPNFGCVLFEQKEF